MAPDFPPAHLWLGRTYQELGQFDDAAAAFRGVDERIRDWPVSIAARGNVAGVSGHQAEAAEALGRVGAAIGPQVCDVLRHRTRPCRPRSERCRLRIAQQCFRGKIELAGLVAPRPALERTTLRSTIYAVGQPNAISAVAPCPPFQSRHISSSLPGLTRQSIVCGDFLRRWMDTRVKPACEEMCSAKRHFAELRAASRPGHLLLTPPCRSSSPPRPGARCRPRRIS